ncbi:hypothetical protein A3193_00955 [Candidatus Thiodiazotropha endoloripes]|uniref:hypothetical protein n=1 Tax=Candidatus Thiodiazotropha endoloripes TaxID=1818881 RepID=UPI00086F9347|nr:hypothetical protein [Candidatus Thiodiazotropha endoloripes]ODB87516.1 hypothetical protein A3193_00955 [Candidatus Thiodiazotropha endoloripes]
MTNHTIHDHSDYKSPFNLKREMGYTHDEIFNLLPRALSDYRYEIKDDVVTIELEKESVLLEIGGERGRRYTDNVYFPILPISISFIDVDKAVQSRFLHKFDTSYMKGLA